VSKITIGDYLLIRLKELGVRHIFGVAGDYNLGFLDQILSQVGLQWIGTCNELNAAYASDGYARIRGIGALVTTFGVGELSAINGIAGSYAENIPVVHIVGVPSTLTQKHKMLVHHTLGDGRFNVFAEMYQKITVAQAYLTQLNAAQEIDHALTACWLYKKPVYLSVPTDISYMRIDKPKKPLYLTYKPSNQKDVNQFVEQAYRLFEHATHTVALVDCGAQRYPMKPLILNFLKQTGIPFANRGMGKAIINESHPQFIGNYNGDFSMAGVQDKVEGADCIIGFGLMPSDLNTGIFTEKLKTDLTIEIHGDSVQVQQFVYPVMFCDAIPALTQRFVEQQYTKNRKIHQFSFRQTDKPQDRLINQQRFWPQISAYLENNSIIIAESGTSLFGAMHMQLPDETSYITQTLWGSIGYTVGALLGVCVADPDRPAVLFVGDGSFQLTAQEISTILRHQLTPTIFLLDNSGYTIERVIHGATMSYNDVQRWNYKELPRIFGNNVWSVQVKTEKELARVCIERHQHKNKMAFITVTMDKMDAPELLLKMAKLMAQRNQYNPTHL
jgi:branched-chain-2-oxoacid decarboxylase